MTARERKAVAETLTEWAAWCEANPGCGWLKAYLSGPDTAAAFEAQFWARVWCAVVDDIGYHRGPTAATGLLLAAAMVEAGDSCD